MRKVKPPEGAWLDAKVSTRLIDEYEAVWARIEQADSMHTEPGVYQNDQNQGMYLKLFLEQAFGDGAPEERARKLIERDFGSLDGLRARFLELAQDPTVDWIVWGLSFASFAFHLFPVGRSVPFCVSPMFCACMRPDVVRAAGTSRLGFAEAQWRHVDWRVVEARLTCLDEPLDVFDEDCGECADESAGECSA
jgi:hypothetical protein